MEHFDQCESKTASFGLSSLVLRTSGSHRRTGAFVLIKGYTVYVCMSTTSGPCLAQLSLDCFEMILSLLDTEDVFNLWLTGDSTFQGGAFGRGLAVTSFGLNAQVVNQESEMQFPSVLASWANIRCLSLQARFKMHLGGKLCRITGLSIPLLPKRLTRLQLTYETVFFELAPRTSGAGISLSEQCPGLLYLSLEGGSVPSLELLSSLPRTLESLRLIYSRSLDPTLLQYLPTTITDLALFTFVGVLTIVDNVSFPPQLNRVYLHEYWSPSILSSLPSSTHTLRLTLFPAVTPLSLYGSLPAGLKVLDIESMNTVFNADAIKAMACQSLQHLTVRSRVYLDTEIETYKSLPRTLESFRVVDHHRLSPPVLWSTELVQCLPRCLTLIQHSSLHIEAPQLLPLLKVLSVGKLSSAATLPPSLQSLTVEAHLSTAAMSSLPSFSLTHLDFRVSPLNKEEVDWIELIPVSLQFLRHNGILSSRMLSKIQSLKSLKTLVIDDWRNSGMDPEDLGLLPPSLTRLEVPLHGRLEPKHIELLPPDLEKVKFRATADGRCSMGLESLKEIELRRLRKICISGLIHHPIGMPWGKRMNFTLVRSFRSRSMESQLEINQNRRHPSLHASDMNWTGWCLQ